MLSTQHSTPAVSDGWRVPILNPVFLEISGLMYLSWKAT